MLHGFTYSIRLLKSARKGRFGIWVIRHVSMTDEVSQVPQQQMGFTSLILDSNTDEE
jgi:hypothetical protein